MEKKLKGIFLVVALLIIGLGAYVIKSEKVEAPILVANEEKQDINQVKETKTNTATQTSPSYNFNLKDTLDYSINFSVKNCDSDTCSGTGVINIKDAKSKALIQTIKSDDLFFFKDTLAKTSTDDTVLYDEQSPIIIGDFNFDNYADLAIRNGSNGGYGAPSYDIYLFNTTNKKFVLSEPLTKLASENQGMFFVDEIEKLLTTFSKDGCCWHKTDQYQVTNNQPVLIYSLIEDASDEGDNVLITEKELIDGKWVTTTKKLSQKEYYGN